MRRPDWTYAVDAWWQWLTVCLVKGHHEKMGTPGHCYRCGRPVSRTTG
ncbi:MAG: hypothetical protein ABWY93_02915 [Mycobacterium sp.]